jgi:hypothetical protein
MNNVQLLHIDTDDPDDAIIASVPLPSPDLLILKDTQDLCCCHECQYSEHDSIQDPVVVALDLRRSPSSECDDTLNPIPCIWQSWQHRKNRCLCLFELLKINLHMGDRKSTSVGTRNYLITSLSIGFLDSTWT